MADEKDIGVKVIEAVKEFPCLYDRKLNDPHSKERGWTAVSMMVNENEEFCIKKWKALRDHFKKLYNRYNIKKEEQGDKALKPSWKHWDHMQFLIKYFDNKNDKASGKKSKKDKSYHEISSPKRSKRKLSEDIPSSPPPSPIKKPKSSPDISFADVRTQAYSLNNDTSISAVLACREPTQIDYDGVANSFGNLVASKLKTFDPVTAEEAMKHIFNHLWSI